jgi:hypothetical protein
MYDLDITVNGSTTSWNSQTDLVDVDYDVYLFDGDMISAECWSIIGDYDLILYDELGYIIDSSYSTGTYDYVANFSSSSSSSRCVPGSGGFAGLLTVLAPLGAAFILRRKVSTVAA